MRAGRPARWPPATGRDCTSAVADDSRGTDVVAAGALSVAGAAVFGSLFLRWFTSEGEFLILFGALDRQPALQTGWELFTVTDLLLAAVGAGSIVVAVLLLAGRAGRTTLAGAA